MKTEIIYFENIKEEITFYIGKNGKDNYIFFKTSKMKKPSFLSLKEFDENLINCDLENLQSWIKIKYNIF